MVDQVSANSGPRWTWCSLN